MRRRRDNRPPPRHRRPPRGKGWGVSPIMVALPLAVFTAVFLLGVPGAVTRTVPAASLLGPSGTYAAIVPGAGRPADDREAARFTRCGGRVRTNCVVDGDTFWYRGEKVRIADINAPETHDAECGRELELGERATARLLALLNQGAFTLAPNDDGTGRDEDRYGRLLRTVTRGGDSVGGALVSEGLAERWKGYRGSWC